MIVDSALYKDGVRQHEEALIPESAAELRRTAGPGEFVWIGVHDPEPTSGLLFQSLAGIARRHIVASGSV